jgi:dihydrofolate synthase / folylpolyglutamate synthase
MNYQEAWLFLDNLQFFKIKLRLDSMEEFLKRVGNPQEKLKFVHVAGTNGKGSVSITMLSILSKAGYRVGLYTSPHLSSVRERFRINNDFISRDDFTTHANEIIRVMGKDKITYFEFSTTLALLWFASQEVDLVILETGMGGRLDATNIVVPLVSLITNVSMDHQAYLGNSLAEVAREKAGIIKQGVPVISGVDSGISQTVVARTCERHGVPLFLLNRDFSTKSTTRGIMDYKGITNTYLNLNQGLPGQYQIDNSALALAACELLKPQGFSVEEPAIQEGLKSVKWPGRLEYFTQLPIPALLTKNSTPVNFLLDGAHNPAGVLSLRDALKNDFKYKKLIMIWGSMSDKDISAVLSLITPLCSQIIFTTPGGERSATPEELEDCLPADCQCEASKADSIESAIIKTWNAATFEDLICIAGSLYLIGEARHLLLGDLV